MPPSMSECCRRLSTWCFHLGSGFYGYLLMRCSVACEQEGPIRDLLCPRNGEERPSSLPVRMLASVHRLVLEGKAPKLAKFYPSVGGSVDLQPAWEAFCETVQQSFNRLAQYIAAPVQTNDIERSAGLLGGFGLIVRQARLPLRLLEIGTSGGLNLRWDRYYYQWAGGSWGSPQSPVHFENLFPGDHPSLPKTIEIIDRIGCDLNPINVGDPEGQLILLSHVFPDEKDRIKDLKAAIAIAQELPCQIHKASARDWLELQLEKPRAGTATVVFHSIVWQYLSDSEQQRIISTIEEAGHRASEKAPLAWLRMEPDQDRAVSEGYEVRLRIYPGFREQLIAIFQHQWHVPSVHWLLNERPNASP